jgi:CheY-like chemotaxis protein
VYLPLPHHDILQLSKHKRDQKARKSMAKVLLVEDDNNLREIYQARLMAEGYQIVAAQDGEEALVIAKKEHPDLIISDVMMPRISGFEMLDILRNTDELKHTKVIMLTALGQAEDQTRANNLGADKYLVKSQVTLEDIVKSAQELLTADGAPMPTAAAAPAAVAPNSAAAAPAAAPAQSAPVVPEESTTPTEPVAPVTTPDVPMGDSAAPAAEPVEPSAGGIPDQTPEAEPPEPESVAMPVAEAPEPVAEGSEPSEPPAAAQPETAAMPVAESPVPDTTPSDATVIRPTSPAPAETASEAAIKSSEPQSLQEEEAAIEKQIESYAAEPAASQTAPTADADADADQSAKVRNDDAVIAKAVEELNTSAAPEAPTPEPAAIPVAEAPEPAPAAETPAAVLTVAEAPAPDGQTGSTDTTADSAPVAGKKIIQPITAPGSAPDLNALLAKETGEAQTTPNQSVTTPTVGNGVDPKSITI